MTLLRGVTPILDPATLKIIAILPLSVAVLRLKHALCWLEVIYTTIVSRYASHMYPRLCGSRGVRGRWNNPTCRCGISRAENSVLCSRCSAGQASHTSFVALVQALGSVLGRDRALIWGSEILGPKKPQIIRNESRHFLETGFEL